jgi:hypothetical protein
MHCLTDLTGLRIPVSGFFQLLQPPAAGIAGAQPVPQVVQVAGAVGGVGRGGGQRLLIGGDGGIQLLQPPAAGIAGAQPGPQVVQVAGAVGGVGRGGGQRLLTGGNGGIQLLQPPAAGIAVAQPGSPGWSGLRGGRGSRAGWRPAPAHRRRWRHPAPPAAPLRA